MMADPIKASPLVKAQRRCHRWLSALTMAAMLAVLCLSMTACQPKAPLHAQSGTGIHKVYRERPATCTVDTNRSKMTIADHLRLKLTVVVPPDYEVKLPPIGAKLARFSIVASHTTAPELTPKGNTRIIRSYVLDPFLAGKYLIPSITIRFWKAGEEPKDTHLLKTDQIPILVSSPLPETLRKLKLHDIAPPVSLPWSMAIWIWAAAIGGVLLAGILICYCLRVRRRAGRASAAPDLPPHEQAYRELERLISENLIEKGEIKAFYQKISGILRRYIEKRFGIRAPEQTTEEFLAGLKGDTTFPQVYHILLRDFLRHCDLVKFAAHQPASQDIRNTLDSCKRFINETRTTATEPPDGG